MLNNRRVLVGSVLRRSGSPRSAKVWLLIGQLGLGGTEKQVALLARGLRDRGVDTSVLVMFDGGPRERELRAAGVPVIYLGFARFSAARNSVRNVVAFARLVGRLRGDRPDILHAFLFHSYVVAAPAARIARVPVLVAGGGASAYSRRAAGCCCWPNAWRPGRPTCSSRTPRPLPRTR